MKRKALVVVLIIFTVFIALIPLILNIPCVAKIASWYFSGLRVSEYKIAYISLIGGFIGVWMAVGTSIIIQGLFEQNMNREKEKIIKKIILSYLAEEIEKNHSAMVTCNSQMHEHVSIGSTVLELAKNKEYKTLRKFNGDFTTDNWNKYATAIFDTDFNSYIVISKLYECYSVVALSGKYTINTSKEFEASGIVEYEKRYDKFLRKYGSLMQMNN